MIQNILLQNGVRLISEPVENTKIASIGFWFPYGSRYEKEGIRGAAHFIEHMLFKGTKNRSAFALAREFDRVGGYVNAFTEREMVCLYCVVPAEYAAQALSVFCDMTVNPLFDPDEFERERTVIESEILSALDDPEDTAQDSMLQVVYSGHALSLPIAGSVRDIRQLRRSDVIAGYTQYFLYGPLTVTAAGAVDAGMMTALLEKSLPLRRSSGLPPCSAPQWQPGAFFLPADFQQSQLFLSYPVHFPLRPEDYTKWCVIDSITGDTMSSRLFQALREQTGFCYNVYSNFSFVRDTGVWSAYASFPPEKTAAVIGVLRDQLDRLAKDGVTAEELRDAAAHLQGEITLSAEDMEYRMKRLARQFYFSGVLSSCAEESGEYDAVTQEDILRLVHSTFTPGSASLILFGRKKHVPAGLKILKKNKDGYYGK